MKSEEEALEYSYRKVMPPQKSHAGSIFDALQMDDVLKRQSNYLSRLISWELIVSDTNKISAEFQYQRNAETYFKEYMQLPLFHSKKGR